jgi:hypothetical protein
MHCFDLFHATEKALIAHVVKSIINQYFMQTHRNHDTAVFPASLQTTILSDLSLNYGNVTPGHISSKKLQVSTMHYDLSMPIDNVFNAIGDLGDLAEAGGSLISHEQMMDLAYLILSNVPMFLSSPRLVPTCSHISSCPTRSELPSQRDEHVPSTVVSGLSL